MRRRESRKTRPKPPPPQANAAVTAAAAPPQLAQARRQYVNAAVARPPKSATGAASSNDDGTINHKKILLAAPEDVQILNPLHCFVRRNVEVFSATHEHISAPSPGRKNRVTVGQVGIRCVHCAHLPSRDRVKRSVCFPPTVSGIYHSVSNMKFDHFGACRGLPPRAREEFAVLRAACGRRGGGRAVSGGGGGAGAGAAGTGTGGLANSTAQYYYDSSSRMGLVDTELGIRFRADAADAAQTQQAQVQQGQAQQGQGQQGQAAAATKAMPQLYQTQPQVPLRPAPLAAAPPLASPSSLEQQLPPLPPLAAANATNRHEVVPTTCTAPAYDGMSALMIAAATRAAEYEQMAAAAASATAVALT